MREYIWLFIMSWVAATVSGTAGFGLSIILLPILTSYFGVVNAIPILTIGQLVSNASRAWFGRKDIRWEPIKNFLITGLPLAIVGGIIFANIDAKVVVVLIGVFLLLVIIFRHLMPKHMAIGQRGMLAGGAAAGFFSGMVGSSGPLSATVFFSLNLTATSYIASEAVASLGLSLAKVATYSSFNLIHKQNLEVGIFISIAMILGSYTGRHIVQVLHMRNFQMVVELLLALCGLLMVGTAFYQ